MRWGSRQIRSKPQYRRFPGFRARTYGSAKRLRSAATFHRTRFRKTYKYKHQVFPRKASAKSVRFVKKRSLFY